MTDQFKDDHDEVGVRTRTSCCRDMCERETKLKQDMEKLLYQNSFGSYLFQAVGFLAAFTSILQLVMQYSANPYQMQRDWYNQLDYAFCMLLAVVWLLKVYSSQHRG